MKKSFVFIILALLATATALIFLGPAPEPASQTPQPAEPQALALHTTTYHNGDRIFDITLDQFIDSYNSFYQQDHGEAFLQPADNWIIQAQAQTVQSSHPALTHIFTADPSVWTLPELTIITPEDSDQIQEINLTYDDHSYSEATYALYEEHCYYTLRVCFPELSEDTLIDLYTSLNQIAYDHTLPSSQQYRPGSAVLPVALYHRNGIGCFTYFAIGAPLHFVILPVDDTLIATYTDHGVQVQEIQ